MYLLKVYINLKISFILKIIDNFLQLRETQVCDTGNIVPPCGET